MIADEVDIPQQEEEEISLEELGIIDVEEDLLEQEEESIPVIKNAYRGKNLNAN